MFQSGDFVFDTLSGSHVQVVERIELWGYTSYKVFDTATGSVYKAAENQLSASSDKVRIDENYLRYVVMLSKIKNETASGILSSLSSGIIPLPHQFHVLNRALKGNNIRYILADEVGLGKTIEAGMVMRELKARGLVKRILVVCPTGLVSQWSVEMKEKFHEKYQVILPSDFDTIRRMTDSEDVYGQFDQVISPMDSIKPMERHAGWTEERVEQYNEERINAIINSGWDLIIIDEAHRVAGSTGEVARYSRGYRTFHRRNCPQITALTQLVGFPRYQDAIHAGYCPCRHCKPSPKQNVVFSIPITNKERTGENTDTLVQLCTEHGVPFQYDNRYFEMQTMVGKWRIDMDMRPVRLEHINLVSQPQNTKNYHVQPRLFLSLKDTFDYIMRHDSTLMKKTEGDNQGAQLQMS